MTSSNGNIFRITGPLCRELGNPLAPVNSPHKGQWCRALMFSLICAWMNNWVNNPEAGDLRCHHAHYDVSVMNLAYWLASHSLDQCRADSRFVPSQWETALLCNDISHWLATNLELALSLVIGPWRKDTTELWSNIRRCTFRKIYLQMLSTEWPVFNNFPYKNKTFFWRFGCQ